MRCEDLSYILQVWSKAGDIVYEKKLTRRPKSWCVTNQFLVYLPDELDQESPDEFCYYIIYLYLQNTAIKINIKGLDIQ